MVAGSGGGEADFAAQMPPDLAERYRSFMAPSYWPVAEIMPVLEEICGKYGNNQYERVQVTMAPSNVHRCSDELLTALKELAGRHSTGIHIHLQETVYQKLYGHAAYSKTPLQHLHDLGFLGPEVTCGHSVWATEEDLGLMAATGANICHNASSNLRLQSGIAPMGRILAAGIKVAIGSDEAGLNDDKDLFQEMRLVLKLHRVPGMDLEPPTSCQVLEMATVNGGLCQLVRRPDRHPGAGGNGRTWCWWTCGTLKNRTWTPRCRWWTPWCTGVGASTLTRCWWTVRSSCGTDD